MPTIRITKIFHFEMAHALWNYDGPCKNIHGHSYKLWVTVSGTPEPDDQAVKAGMVMDFGELKHIVQEMVIDRFDHSVMINNKAPHKLLKNIDQMFDKYEVTNYQPTCENLIIDFVKIIETCLPKHIKLTGLKLQETENSFAEWLASDNC